MGVEMIKLTAGDRPDAARSTEVMQKEMVFIQQMIHNLLEAAKCASGTIELNKKTGAQARRPSGPRCWAGTSRPPP
jgi:hypothetical protein